MHDKESIFAFENKVSSKINLHFYPYVLEWLDTYTYYTYTHTHTHEVRTPNKHKDSKKADHSDDILLETHEFRGKIKK